MPTPNSPCKLIKITAPEVTGSTKDLSSRLSYLSQSIHEAYQEADEKRMEQAYKTFTKLTKNAKCTPADWHKVREKSKKWLQPPFPSTLY